MTRRSDIPYGAWPRGLGLKRAAAYRGVSPNKWLAEVDAGLWPKPETSGGRKIWDRLAIDEAWDHHVAEGKTDPLMEALNDSQA